MPRSKNTWIKYLLKKLSIVVFAAISDHTAEAQEPTVNTLDLYRTNTQVSCSFSTLDQDVFMIYALLDFKEAPVDSLWISYSWQNPDHTVNDSTLVKPGDRQQVLTWSFANDNIPPMITVRLNYKSRKWVFQEHFPMDAYHSSGGVSLWQSSYPILKTWIHLGDSILLQSQGNNNVFIYFYDHQFDPSRPPMTVRPAQGSASLTIDSLFTMAAGEYYQPHKQGLYFFQNDTTGTIGTSLVVTDVYFPKPQEVSDLTEPLIYITTRAEYQELQQDFSDKQALDKFWLTTLGSPDKARTAIKNYYQNIENANTLFTSYKEGWKTDRGMIYTVLGAPLEVTKTQDTELWIYRDISGDELRFEFRKVSNIFSNNHYELFRNESYDRQWFIAIDRWREGRMQ